MTPEQKLKWAVVSKAYSWRGDPEPGYPCENVDELYSQLVNANAHWDAKEEIRTGRVETNLPCYDYSAACCKPKQESTKNILTENAINK